MNLENVALACHGILSNLNTPTVEFQGAAVDSRKVMPGNLFFATIGEQTDGHRFIQAAFDRGACCVITQKTPETLELEYALSADGWGSYILVEDSLRALREIAEAYRQSLSIPIIGITGSVGKTSTKECIATVLSQRYQVWKTQGNFNNEIGLPLTILGITSTHEVAVLEMGISDFGEMRRLSKIARPDICVLTNIGQSHLLELKSRDGILHAKMEIFEFMSPSGSVVLNGDDDKLRTIKEVHGKRPYYYGSGTGGMNWDVSIVREQYNGLLGSELVLRMSERLLNATKSPDKVSLPGKHMAQNATILSATVSLPGKHMAQNAMAAVCVAKLLSLTDTQIQAGLAAQQPTEGRGRITPMGQGCLIDECYNANPVSVKAAIDLLCFAQTPQAAILGDMLNLGEDSDALHREIGVYAVEKGIDKLVFIGENAYYAYLAAEQSTLYQEGIHHTKTALPNQCNPTAAEIHYACNPTTAEIHNTCNPTTSEIHHAFDPIIADDHNLRNYVTANDILFFKTTNDFFQAWMTDLHTKWSGYSILVKASHGMHFETIVERLLGN
ncbi:MAG: UDP-N-acetylmuramoyl-tripeptide--D-alanyl-D-alanine ligase [Clostridium sp.]|jgi:UDP-N-acetylmuramoyl-tripeptide--D-alanyl-D-alanine ligase|nr:UDP-N-acetylmuramoyl-tripeptide--D-alanyl-D-alanine ligase [Clostridium sp.]